MCKKTILYIEKEEFLKNMFEVPLNKRGYKLFWLNGHEDSIFRIEDLKPQIVIIDFDTVGENSFFSYLEEVLTLPFISKNSIIVTCRPNHLELLRKIEDKIRTSLARPIQLDQIIDLLS